MALLGQSGLDLVSLRTMTNALMTLTHVTRLDLGSTRSSDEALALVCGLLKKNTHITVLEYWSNAVRDAGLVTLCETLNACGLEALDLGGNRLKAAHAAEIANVLKSNRRLMKLSLNNNDIADDGACAIADALRRNDTLTEITITNNDIVAYGAPALVEAVEKNYALLAIDLSRNNAFTPANIATLASYCARNKVVDSLLMCRFTESGSQS